MSENPAPPPGHRPFGHSIDTAPAALLTSQPNPTPL